MNSFTITRCVLVTLLAFHFSGVCGSAQDASPIRDEAKPVETAQPPAATTSVEPLAASQMPDISGKWWAGESPLVIWRTVDGTADFVLESTSVNAEEEMSRSKWSQQTQQFEGAIVDSGPIRISRFTMKLLPDGKTMRVSLFLDKPKQEVLKEFGLSESKLDEYLNQEWTRTKKSAGKANDSADAVTVPAKPEMIVPFGNSKIPDISGTWRYERLNLSVGEKGDELSIGDATAVVTRVEGSDSEFAVHERLGTRESRWLVKWSSDNRRFELRTPGIDKTMQITTALQPLAGGRTIRASFYLDDESNEKVKFFNPTEEVTQFLTPEWKRVDPIEDKDDPASGKSKKQAAAASPNIAPAVVRALPDTPAAKQLVEQLGAQESAAAAEAATIRQLQANGQAEQNQPPIAEHQRKLKNLLSTAFDLKLQWEELQVKELQSRLSRLERQIGQRKELREKIIARRAAELVEGDVLRWTPDAARSTPAAPLTANPAALETPAANVSLGVEATSKLIWEKIGVKFGEPVTTEKLESQGPKYRGGLPIVEVHEASSAHKNGILKGDVLVGLHKSETTSLDNVVWILKQFEAAPKSDQTGWGLTFFVIRGGETRVGYLEVEGPSAAATKNDSSQSSTKSLDEWLAVLKTSRKSLELTAAVQELVKLGTGSDAERAAAAFLAAAEFINASDQPNVMISQLKHGVNKMDRSVQTSAIANAVRDGPVDVKEFAVLCVGPLKDHATEQDFPALAEQVLKIATSEVLYLKLDSLRLLGETLPITELNAADFSTEERREMARRLTEHVPRSRVISLLAKALDGKDIDAALLATAQLAKLSDNTKSEVGPAKLLDVLTRVLKGKRDEVVATKQQRGQALETLKSLHARAAPAVPVLIELLKSDDPDLKSVRQPFDHLGGGQSGGLMSLFTREKIISALEQIGSAAKDVLPDLEAAVVVLEKKEKEDELLSTNAKSPPNKPSEQLRDAIIRIKLGGTKRS